MVIHLDMYFIYFFFNFQINISKRKKLIAENVNTHKKFTYVRTICGSRNGAQKISRTVFESDRSTTTKELTGTLVKIPGCCSAETA